MKKNKFLFLFLIPFLLPSCGRYISSKISSHIDDVLFNDPSLYFEDDLEVHCVTGYYFTANGKKDNYLKKLFNEGFYEKDKIYIRNIGLVEQNELLYFSINTDDGTINFVRYNISTELIINTKATFETIFNEKYEKKDNISYICSQNISNSNEYYCFSIFDKNYGKQFKQYVALDKNTLGIVYHGNDEESLYHDDGFELYDASNITINGKTFAMNDIKFSRYISKDDTEIYEGRDGFVESIVCQYDNTYIITANGFEYKFYVYRLDLETMTAFQVGRANRSGIPTAIVKRGN